MSYTTGELLKSLTHKIRLSNAAAKGGQIWIFTGGGSHIGECFLSLFLPYRDTELELDVGLCVKKRLLDSSKDNGICQANWSMYTETIYRINFPNQVFTRLYFLSLISRFLSLSLHTLNWIG